jgi:hypothetical protein
MKRKTYFTTQISKALQLAERAIYVGGSVKHTGTSNGYEVIIVANKKDFGYIEA